MVGPEPASRREVGPEPGSRRVAGADPPPTSRPPSSARVAGPDPPPTDRLTGSKWQVCRSSLETLYGENLLDDEVISSYAGILASGSQGKVVAFSVFWLNAMRAKPGPAATEIRSALCRHDAEKAQVWLMPYNLNGLHWALVVVLLQARRIVHLDSLGLAPPSDVSLVHVQRLIKCAQTSHGTPNVMKWNGWALVTPKNTPLQRDSHSCGVHVCWHARAAATAVATAAPLDVPRMRQEIRRTLTGVS